MRDSSIDNFQKAKNYAFLLLKFRPRSEKEIFLRLQRKKFDLKVIAETLEFLKERKFIDDRCFARAWIESRIKKPSGLNLLRQELRLKGVEQEIISDLIRETKESYSEKETVVKIAQDKLKKLKNIEPNKAKRRVCAFLLRRGFSPDVVSETLNDLI